MGARVRLEKAKWVRVAGLALAASLAGCPDSKTSVVEPKLTASKASLDFSKVRPGRDAKLTLEVASASAVPLDFSGATISGDGAAAFSVSGLPSQLAPEESATIEVRFAPSAEGDFAAVLSIASTDPASPAKVALTGRGANPKLRLLVECRDPCSLFTANQTPPALDFGARRPLRHGADGKVIGEPAWPTVTLLNEGELPVEIASLVLEGSPDFSTAESLPATGFPVAAGAGQSLHVVFDPASRKPASAGRLVVRSDDPVSPELSVALSGSLAPAPDVSVCAAIVETQGADGSLATPKNAAGEDDFAGAQPPVQPGRNARVTFSAYSDHFLAAKDPTLCTGSPETGREGLTLQWTLVERPAASSAQLAGAATAEPTLAPDAIGHYQVRLDATDANGKSGSATVDFDAYPRRDLVAQLSWPESGIDLDLHLVRPGVACGGSCVFDPEGDLNGFSVRSGGKFDWGAVGAADDDPRLDRDDLGTQGGIETVSLDHPEADPACAAAGTCTYGLYVHYFADARSTSGAGAACSGAGCFEGDACTCAGSLQCVAAHCVSPARPSVAIYVKPGPATPPVVLPVPGEVFGIAGACFLWHLADVTWKADGTAQVVAAGAAGARELEYWGKMTPGSFACSPNTDPSLPAGYLPGTIPEYL